MKTKIVFGMLLLTISAAVQGQNESVRARNFNLRNGLAIEGYDPVSYFEGKPVEGKSALKTSYQGVTYYFATQAHLDQFHKTPDKYEPAYGGWCAYAMGDSGEKVKIDPETYKIIDGRLYLFYNFWGNNTLTSWNKDEARLKRQADSNWLKAAK